MSGMTREEAIKRAIESAKCRIYKSNFDLEGKLSARHQRTAENQKELMEITVEALEKLLGNDINVGSKWIPCSERLPDTKTKPYQSVLLQVGNSIVVGYVNSAGQWFVDTGDGWCSELDDKPVAWQPLPEPYKEGET